MVIGITGQSGCGKSTVSSYFNENGYYVADCDEMVHNAYLNNIYVLEKIRKEFGAECFDVSGNINRRKLASIVFNDRKKLNRLNDITFSYITEEIQNIINREEKVVIDAPLLFESKLNEICDVSLYVLCPEDERINRIMKRDNLSYELVKERLNSQNNDEYYRCRCSKVIINDGKQSIGKQLKEFFV